ncbi:FolC bifunctional protein [Dothidotthia symphoricarpi CBS 119687]|uniref:Folylpolyglutamate synthase n=1 Tax=Dothidotthia symphoricarpi CBS 119687 TaxID=1392245 RepID=A0A6A6ALQ9_9PLEO|nr:FolC bifunctional protein [Dothidotthia symphoricarpi CBS 119687]KAF2132103.1 FolC bifunctional protein [Dothidotthia symphoricarpi CBS 119687]
MEKRDYAAAVAALNTLQSNFSIVDAIRKSGRGMNTQAIPEMLEWCRKVGYEPAAFDRLKPIHIAGTKGKGSTSAFISSILAQYIPSNGAQTTPSKVGLYTSPHLRFVRERIQINNEPVSEAMFAKYFFDVWDRLEAAAAKAETTPTHVPTKPVYFRYLTLMALHAYLEEGVDTAVIECGIGGEYDSTNIITKPTVTAVTSLGIDHTAMLGSTLPEIAWHKAGIFKAGAVAFTSPQKEEAMTVLRERAAEKGTSLHVINVHPALANNEVKLGLSAFFQKVNASVAIAAAAAHLRALGHVSIPDPTTSAHIDLPPEFIRGLEQVRWPGRCEIRREKHVAWHLDGGHTLESIELTGRWFAEQMEATQSQGPRVMIFNQQTRDASALAKALYATLQNGVASGPASPFTHVIFTTNQTFNEGYRPDLISMNTNQQDVDTLAVQKALAATWSEIDSSAEVQVLKTIEEAIGAARAIARDWAKDSTVEVMVLVTGSLHLVGGALEVLETGKTS